MFFFFLIMLMSC